MIHQLDCGQHATHAITARSWTSFKKDQRGLKTQEQRGLMIPGTHDVGQVGLMSQWLKTKELGLSGARLALH